MRPTNQNRLTAVALVAGVAMAGVSLLVPAPAATAAGTTPTTTAGTAGTASATPTCGGRCGVQQAARALVGMTGGPPGVVIEVQQGSTVHTVVAGTADVTTGAPPTADDQMRVASVAKAWSGAAALALVTQHRLSLDDTVGRWLPGMPKRWRHITLRQLLNHTSRIPDFSAQPAFLDDLLADPEHAPPPADLLNSVRTLDLLTVAPPGYHYSNSDNVLVALMVEAVTHTAYETELTDLVNGPLGLDHTTLPTGAAVPSPILRGYAVEAGQPPTDYTEYFAAGWAWASGGVVSTPAELNAFIRADVSGRLVSPAVHRAQFTFVPGGGSEPPGPGTNAAGLALFRYSMPCGTVYGHTGNTLGYTQFAAAGAGGTDSVTVSVNAQITPKQDPTTFAALRALDQRAACFALGH